MSRGGANTELRQAFQFEVRPDLYVQRVVWTAVVVGVALAAQLMNRNQTFVVDLVAPVTGWHARNPDGSLYMEIWANLLANGLQAGFAIWAGWLLLLGLGRLIVNKRLVKACFGLATAFGVMAAAVPPAVALAFQMAIQKFPALGG